MKRTIEETLPMSEDAYEAWNSGDLDGLPANDLRNIPAAACSRCGGWTSFGGMSQHHDATEPVMGRTGCDCHKPAAPAVDHDDDFCF